MIKEYTVHTQNKFPLLDAFLYNNEASIKEFYIAEYPKIKYYILKKGGTVSSAEDVFQEAFFACWKKLCSGKFCPKNKAEIEAYLFTAAKNKWMDQLRVASKKRTVSIDEKFMELRSEETMDAHEHKEREQKLSITLTAFEKLGKDCKELLTQFYFHKKSLRNISHELNIEEASAKNKKYRCIQKLKELALLK